LLHSRAARDARRSHGGAALRMIRDGCDEAGEESRA
jgi:hypothetical protein